MGSPAPPALVPCCNASDNDFGADVQFSASTPNNGAKKKTYALTPSPVQLRLDSKFDAVGNKELTSHGVSGADLEEAVVSSSRRCLELTSQGTDIEEAVESSSARRCLEPQDVSGSDPEVESEIVEGEEVPNLYAGVLKIRAKQGQIGSYFKGHPPPKDAAKKMKFEQRRALFYAERALILRAPRHVKQRSNFGGRVAGLDKARRARKTRRVQVLAQIPQLGVQV